MAGITPGEQVFFYHDERLHYLRRVLEKGDFECHKGRIPWGQIIGCNYGEVVKTHMGVSFTLLSPSLADLMIGVKRRTTIAYPKDVGYMLLRASIAPGVRVAEVGSGSGALTFILARYVQPQGHVYSFERRPEFLEVAMANVARLGMEEFVTFELRDVEKQGFGVRGIDVCVVDVPEPWGIVPHAAKALVCAGRWVSLSPTTEQLQETRKALGKHGFTRFEVWEVMLREMLIRPQGARPRERMISHTAYLAFAEIAEHNPDASNAQQTIDNSPAGNRLSLQDEESSI
ncbi:MAG: tRNA (adenine-N1)-methyltransferase [Candidatus Stahlbacteria bacterium]|nr:MAG: tRNA (adenine-N1)-methyltransferase [Candidatus Stahlbacteria bacterium]